MEARAATCASQHVELERNHRGDQRRLLEGVLFLQSSPSQGRRSARHIREVHMIPQSAFQEPRLIDSQAPVTTGRTAADSRLGTRRCASICLRGSHVHPEPAGPVRTGASSQTIYLPVPRTVAACMHDRAGSIGELGEEMQSPRKSSAKAACRMTYPRTGVGATRRGTRARL
ncbi:hypothetical protein EVG20_g7807 [Dentipellis fragilis]|uniref:Uncharacterized protein n=1 Tax=Dentipellis fragilis TaxID=205917 RepID=A0A4Y9YAQ4_9AGAM|nr:hypothetical protein EVG20_g7807 [Dentipellis fragilis]